MDSLLVMHNKEPYLTSSKCSVAGTSASTITETILAATHTTAVANERPLGLRPHRQSASRFAAVETLTRCNKEEKKISDYTIKIPT